MKQTLNVEIRNDKLIDYNIVICDDEISCLKKEIDTLTINKKRLVVFSEKVYKLYKNDLDFANNEILIIKDGEKEKNFKNYTKILEKAIDLNLNRDDFIIAIGGGVIGDIVAFAASTYMRGIKCVQIPTTLLSMVDSSVGGKTAIDFCGMKNLVGTFFQPYKVYININFIKTLDEKQYRSGIGEIIKYAFIEKNCGYKQELFFFEYLTLCCEKLLERERMTLMRVIEHSLIMKIAVVSQDEKENNIRRFLNFGHTFGHALETITGYKKLTHGEAVIQGIYFIFKWAYSKNLVTYSYYQMAYDLIQKYGFKCFDYSKYSFNELVRIMQYDKKAQNGKITFVVPTDKKVAKIKKLTPDEVFQML